MTDDFAARRAAARQRLDAIDPAKSGRLDDPYRRDWFRAVYDLADGDEAAVPWADKAAHPLLREWLDSRALSNLGALDVGCGLGDNAEALAAAGARTTAFDLSEDAISWANRRFPQSRVDYRAADLFDPPAEWRAAFDFVHECYTLQALPNRLLPEAGRALASFLKPGGRLLVIARSRPNPAAPDGPPWPLARGDIEALMAHGLVLESIEEIAWPDEPAHWRALYRRAA
ncbi:MAG: class I SAM-dependent methyltransferase [Rhodoblastus sp.]|nr:class I SAM-dependent methyltransferase [Rhodoblastus sp.]